MRRLTLWAAGILVLSAGPALLAQQGQGGAPKRPDTTIQDFKRAMALQADPEQISDFKGLSRNTEDARKQAHDLQEKAAAATDATGFYKPATTLRDSVDQVQSDNQAFVRGLTKVQATLLKDHTKKISKAQSEVVKENKNLDEEARRSTIDPHQLADVAGRLEKALADLQAQQRSLADEIGIP